jgi:D-lactate dehydrogenase
MTRVLVMGHRADETVIYQKLNEKYHYEFEFTPEILTLSNLHITKGYDALCIIVGCKITEEVAKLLKENGIKYLLTRAAGTDHLDMSALRSLDIKAAYVPAYSPNAISEHTVLLILSLLRKLKKQLEIIRNRYFFLTGLRGRELRSLTVGVIGTGRIGQATVKNLSGFGCRILVNDILESDQVKPYAEYVSKEKLFEEADILVLHCPMNKENYHMINEDSIARMKDGVILVNTARGALVDAGAVYQNLVSGKVSAFAMDVYEYEDKISRKDFRGKELEDKLFERLIDLDNVIFTTHTAFYTDEAIENIIDISLSNLKEYLTTGSCRNEVK